MSTWDLVDHMIPHLTLTETGRRHSLDTFCCVLDELVEGKWLEIT